MTGIDRAADMVGDKDERRAQAEGASGAFLDTQTDEEMLGRAFTFAEKSIARAIRAGERAGLVKPGFLERLTAPSRKQLEEELGIARKEVESAHDVLADLSHEMKTPLNAVIGFAQAMEAETYGPLGSPKYKEYAGHIAVSGDHLLSLVMTILDVSKVNAGRRALKRIQSDPALLAADSAAMVAPAAEEAGLYLQTCIADDLPTAWLEPRAVRQILVNLLANAVKFTSDGGVTLSAREADGAIVYQVVDTGVGMSMEELDKLGSRFTLAQSEGVRGAGGSGLGLSLVNSLAQLHGGALKLESAPGEGLTATVTLPVGAPAFAHRPRPAAIEAPAPAPGDDVQSQLDRIDAYRRERARDGRASAA